MHNINFISSQCGAKECEIRFAGRWGSSSRHFATYMEEGINTYNLSRNENEIDPIRKLWVWKPCNFGDTVDACSNCGHVGTKCGSTRGARGVRGLRAGYYISLICFFGGCFCTYSTVQCTSP